MVSIAIKISEYKRSLISRIWNYLEVGRLLHVIAATTMTLTVFLFSLLHEAILNEDTYGIIIYGYLFLNSGLIPLFTQLDAHSRFQNYKMMKDLLWQYGFQIRFIKSFKHTKCQREAAIYAARDLGCKNQMVQYFKACGYKWYHVMPDFMWSHPQYLLTKKFWSSTFFVKTYHPRFYTN